jgi:hypothetical protein
MSQITQFSQLTTIPVPVPSGGTGDVTLLNHAVLLGAGTSPINTTAVGATGTVLIGNTAADPSWSATPTVTSMTVSNAPVATTDAANKAYVDAANIGLQYVNLVLTSAQIKALVGTPIAVIAAPGPGNMISLISSVVKMNYGGSNVFVASSGQIINLTYGVGGAVIYSGFLNNAHIVASSSQTGMLTSVNISGASNTYENFAVYAVNNSSTNISGNAAGDNTINISLVYKILTI